MAGETGEAITLTFEQRLAELSATAGALAVAETEASEAEALLKEKRGIAWSLDETHKSQARSVADEIRELAESGELAGEDLYEAVGQFAGAVSGATHYFTNFGSAKEYRSRLVPGEPVLLGSGVRTLAVSPEGQGPSVIPILASLRSGLVMNFKAWIVGDDGQPEKVTLSTTDWLGKEKIENRLDYLVENAWSGDAEFYIRLAENYAAIGEDEKAAEHHQKAAIIIGQALALDHFFAIRPISINFLQSSMPEMWQAAYDKFAQKVAWKGIENLDSNLKKFLVSYAEALNPNFGRLTSLEQNQLEIALLTELTHRAEELDKQDSADASETKE